MKALRPHLYPESWVFCTIDEKALHECSPKYLGMFREPEGVTLILERAEADAREWFYESTWSCIILATHTDLTAVGILATVSQKLAAADIPLNAISGYYHDHLFVPQDRAEEALEILADVAA